MVVSEENIFPIFLHPEKSAFRCRKSIVPASIDPRRKYFRYCCDHVKVKVVRNQVYRRSKVVLGVLRLSTYVVGYSAKKGPFPDEEEKCVFFLWARKTKFSEAHRKKLSLFSTSTVKLDLFWLKTQQLRWTTPLAHQELPCSCDKLDFWQPWLFHGRNKSGNIFPRIYWCRKNTITHKTSWNIQNLTKV